MKSTPGIAQYKKAKIDYQIEMHLDFHGVNEIYIVWYFGKE